MSTSEEKSAFEGWAILELMGHRRLAGYLSEQAIGGASFIRIDVPGDGDTKIATQFYSGAAVYCITPTTEAIARAVAKRSEPAPVQRWELAPELPAATEPWEARDAFQDGDDDETVNQDDDDDATRDSESGGRL
jgi:hypothetical protein